MRLNIPKHCGRYSRFSHSKVVFVWGVGEVHDLFTLFNTYTKNIFFLVPPKKYCFHTENIKLINRCCRRYSSYMYRGQQHRRSSSTDEGTVGAHQTLHFQKCSKKTILLYSHLSNTLFVPFIFILTFVAWTFGSREFIKILWNINLHWLLKLTDYRMAIFR